MPWRYLLTAVCAISISLSSSRGEADDPIWVYDIVILSGSEAGYTAALQAARMGHDIALIEPTGHPGGMAVEGIAGDIKHNNQAVLSGIAREFYEGIAEHYGRKLPDSFPRGRWRPSYEPSAASEVIEKMLAQHPNRITLFRKQRIREGIEGVEKEGPRLRAVILEDGTCIEGKIFIDASIEGHLLHFAGVSTSTGRESNETYEETLNGIRARSPHRNFNLRIDPYIDPGHPESGLIATVQEGDLGVPGSSDPHIMGFCFRQTLTRDPDLAIPIPQPENYDPANYEIYRRYLAAGGSLYSPSGRLPNGKTDLGSWHDLSGNLYGENVTYPSGSYAEQERVVRYHRDFVQGLYWFLQNEPSVPEKTRAKWAGWGLPRDEFVDNGHWNRRLYIRSARRMVSDFVHTEAHTRWPDPEPVADPVAMAWWPPDMHHARRIVRDGAVYNEGFVYGDGGWSPFGISYRSLVPKRDEASNLLTPTCPSSSYVAYGAIRILITFKMLGQAAGTAAAIAVEEDCAVQDVPYEKLRERLVAGGLILEIPEGAAWDGKRKISYDHESNRYPKVAEPDRVVPRTRPCQVGAFRNTGQFPLTSLPEALRAEEARIITIGRTSPGQPGRGWECELENPATLYLLVMDRGETEVPGWTLQPDLSVEWKTDDGKTFRDRVYRRSEETGTITIPPHSGKDAGGWHGIPHALIVVPGNS